MFSHLVFRFCRSFPLRKKQFLNKKREICKIRCIGGPGLQIFCWEHSGGSHLADPFPVCFTADVRTQLQRQMVLLLPWK